MILTDGEIIECIEEGALLIDPFKDSLINPASLDFRLGNIFSKVKPKMLSRKTVGLRNCPHSYVTDAIDITNSKTFQTLEIDQPKRIFSSDVDKKIAEENKKKFWIGPQEFIIATSLEKFDFKGTDTYGLVAQVVGKSSIGRLGLANSNNVAGFIDCGFNSYITLELFNYNKYPIILTSGMKIGQLVISRTRVPIKDYKLTGRYVSQKPGTGSLGV